MNELFKIFSAGVLKENPTFVLFLGMCPALGVTTSLVNALGMGIGVIVVLVSSNIIVSLIRNIVKDEIRIPVYIVVIASLVTILQMFMQAYAVDLYNSLGVFLPLIVVNCIILGRAEAFASQNGPVKSAIDGLGMGTGFALAIAVIGICRELIGTGALAGLRIFPEAFAVPVFITPMGAFLTIGVLSGIITTYTLYRNEKQKTLAKTQAVAKNESEVA